MNEAAKDVLQDIVEQLDVLQNLIERVMMGDGASEQTKLAILTQMTSFQSAQKVLLGRIAAL